MSKSEKTISGPAEAAVPPKSITDSIESVVARVRDRAEILSNESPNNAAIAAAINGFAGQFQFWYNRVIEEAVPKYRDLIVSRINPFVRRIEYRGLTAEVVARRLVSDYVNRNFVTAGGWAIERMAIALGANNAKAAAIGIDLQRTDPATGDQHLYVIKSGKVTRNSDILKALKQHTRSAEKLIMQGGAKTRVYGNYAIAAGATSTTFHDGIRRPSSAQFWSEITGLEPTKALALAAAISQEAAEIIQQNTDKHINALGLLIESYIGKESEPTVVDWDFLFDRTMKEKTTWTQQDKERNAKSVAKLVATGYNLAKVTKTSEA